MAERTYGEDEIQALLGRAAQLQAAAQGQPAPGLTAAELEQVAAEAGIDPRFLHEAVREAERGIRLRKAAGQTATHVFVERTVPGTLTDTEWADVVHRLRRQWGSEADKDYGLGPQYGPGVTETLGNTRTWRHTSTFGVSTTAAIRSADGVQHLRMERRVGMGSPSVDGFILGTLVALVAGATAGSIAPAGWVVLLVVLAALAVAAPLIAAADRRWRARKLDEAEGVADEIVALIHDDTAEEAEATGPVALPGREAPPLDLDALPEEPEAEPEAEPSPARRTRA